MKEKKSLRDFSIVFLSGLLIGGILTFLTFLLLSQRCIRGPVPLPPDTATIISPDSAGKPAPPELPAETGKAEPTKDTTWLTDTVHVPIPLWSIQLVDYRNAALKIAAVRPLRKDSVEVYSATWYAPGGFQIREEYGKIVVDTFPLPKPLPEKKKIWHWYASAGTSYASDSTHAFMVRPYMALGGEFGSMRLGRVALSLVPLQLSYGCKINGAGGVLVASSFLTVRF